MLSKYRKVAFIGIRSYLTRMKIRREKRKKRMRDLQ